MLPVNRDLSIVNRDLSVLNKALSGKKSLMAENTRAKVFCIRDIFLFLPCVVVHSDVAAHLFIGIVRSVCFILVSENLGNFQEHTRMAQSVPTSVSGVGLLSIHEYVRVFLGPSETLDSTQFHAFFLYNFLMSLW